MLATKARCGNLFRCVNHKLPRVESTFSDVNYNYLMR